MIQNGIIQNIELSSKLENLVQIETFVDEVCEYYDISEDNYGNILIALTEAVNNAITHGNHLNPNKKVSLKMGTSDSEVLFTIKDEGDGFDFKNVPDPTLPENIQKLNGRGIFLIRSLADDVVFEGNGSIVKLKFCISAN
ncbi:MAG: serine/threonine protein kinase [Bacteroidetes bacterium RIFCSPLOWO2_12_FULL_31_6]|nr:MAG: serine/threonine protein kinase [Bacteroidetes bacterium RIFCSPLOWO2_12_FULL_31_6]